MATSGRITFIQAAQVEVSEPWWLTCITSTPSAVSRRIPVPVGFTYLINNAIYSQFLDAVNFANPPAPSVTIGRNPPGVTLNLDGHGAVDLAEVQQFL